jgi:hypothetical protein
MPKLSTLYDMNDFPEWVICIDESFSEKEGLEFGKVYHVLGKRHSSVDDHTFLYAIELPKQRLGFRSFYTHRFVDSLDQFINPYLDRQQQEELARKND